MDNKVDQMIVAIRIAKSLNYQAIGYKKTGQVGFYEDAVKARNTWMNIARSYKG